MKINCSKRKNWIYSALDNHHVAIRLSFATTGSYKIGNKNHFSLMELNTIVIPREVYNQILRDKKLNAVLQNKKHISVKEMYIEFRRYIENFECKLQDIILIHK